MWFDPGLIQQLSFKEGYDLFLQLRDHVSRGFVWLGSRTGAQSCTQQSHCWPSHNEVVRIPTNLILTIRKMVGESNTLITLTLTPPLQEKSGSPQQWLNLQQITLLYTK